MEAQEIVLPHAVLVPDVEADVVDAVRHGEVRHAVIPHRVGARGHLGAEHGHRSEILPQTAIVKSQDWKKLKNLCRGTAV